MNSNFDFLKPVNENLYLIALEAEKLFRDEYFEQCITQTRRLAENICRDVIGEKANPSDSFDTMLATLKDTPSQNDFEKEFIDDLYFLKKAGNTATHSLKVKQDGNIALDCLQRAFEASLNYAIFKKGINAKYLKLQFSEETLATGKKSKQSLIEEKYTKEKATQSKLTKTTKTVKKNSTKNSNTNKTNKINKNTNNNETCNSKSSPNKKKPLWKEFVEILLAIIIITIVYFLVFAK